MSTKTNQQGDEDFDEFGRNRHGDRDEQRTNGSGRHDDGRYNKDEGYKNRYHDNDGKRDYHARNDEDYRGGRPERDHHRNGGHHGHDRRERPRDERRYREHDYRDRRHHGDRRQYDDRRRYEDDRQYYQDDRRHYDNNNESDRRHHSHQHEEENAHYRDFENPRMLEAGIIVRGRVSRMESYGAFVDFETAMERHRGLVHISQLSEGHVQSVEQVVQLNQPVFCSVLEIQQMGNQRPRIRLSLKDVDQVTGRKLDSSSKATSHATRDPFKFRRATDRVNLFRQEACSWKDAAVQLPYEHLLYSRSPSPPRAKAKQQESSDSESSSSSSSSESSSSSFSSSSSEESRRRGRKRRGSDRRSRGRRSSRSRRSRRKRRRSPSSSSSSSSDSSSSPSSSSSSVRSSDKKRARRDSTDEPSDPTKAAVPAKSNVAAMDEEDLREAKEFRGAVQGTHEQDDSDDDDEGPMPLPQTNTAASGGSGKNEYGKALLPGEGQALAAYVQQNLRIPRRGEIGYSGEQVEQYEKSGYVMSGSRHARMNAVRIRKENQVYSAEEQRALALITAEENQQKEAQLLQDFRTMLKEKQKLRERPKEGGKEGGGS